MDHESLRGFFPLMHKILLLRVNWYILKCCLQTEKNPTFLQTVGYTQTSCHLNLYFPSQGMYVLPSLWMDIMIFSNNKYRSRPEEYIESTSKLSQQASNLAKWSIGLYAILPITLWDIKRAIPSVIYQWFTRILIVSVYTNLLEVLKN